MFHKTKPFKELEKEWYDKLKEEGFKDIEDASSSERYLHTWHSHYFNSKYTPVTFENKAEYYCQAQEFFENHFAIHQHFLFEKPLEGLIWELHVMGMSVRIIAKKLQIKICKVHQSIVESRKKMKSGQKEQY